MTVETLAAASAGASSVPRRDPNYTLLVGDLRTGRIGAYLSGLPSANWERVLDDAGSINGVQVPEVLVRAHTLRATAAAARCFLAVDYGGRIMQAGPIWAHSWDEAAGTLTLGAGGLWSLFDHRKVLPVLAAGQRVQDADTVISGIDLGGIGVEVVAQAMTHLGGELPLVLPPLLAGTRTETFLGFNLPNLGDQLRQLTTRETMAPNIRFTPRYTSNRLGIEWVMEVGTEAAPQLVQAGDDWVFDRTTKRSPVINIVVDVDGKSIGTRAWVTGAGSERERLIASATDPAGLIPDGMPLLEVDDSRSSVGQDAPADEPARSAALAQAQATLDGHAANLAGRVGRPVEAWKVTVRAAAAAEVKEGDYARLNVRGSAYLPDGEHRCRVLRVNGALTDQVTLSLVPSTQEA